MLAPSIIECKAPHGVIRGALVSNYSGDSRFASGRLQQAPVDGSIPSISTNVPTAETSPWQGRGTGGQAMCQTVRLG
jgi:hypothetical protein